MTAMTMAISTLLFFVFVTFPCLIAAGTKQEGLDWLSENAKKEGVISDYSGMQYKILHKGHGVVNPFSGQAQVACHFEGRLMNGDVFDSTYKEGKPFIFRPVEALDAWFPILLKMVVGDIYELYLPSELGFGDTGSENKKVGGGEVLIYKLELVKILGKTKSALECDPANPKRKCSAKEQAFIASARSKEKKELRRKLVKLSEDLKTSVEPETEWIHRQSHILNQVLKMNDHGAIEEL